MSQQLNETQNIVVGVIAAFIEAIILQPTLYWKNAKASGLPFTMNPRVIYRGTAASIFNECQMMGLQFGTTSFFQRLSVRKEAVSSNIDGILPAALGGAVTALSSSPIELVMIQQQRFGGSIMRVPVQIFLQHGLFSKGLMRGLLPTMMRDAIYVVGMLGVTPIIQDSLQDQFAIGSLQAGFYASICGGLIGSLPSQPFDVIKTCMQADIDRKVYKSFAQSCSKLWSEGGIKRLFQGSAWRAVNITGTIFVANECRQRLPPVIFE